MSRPLAGLAGAGVLAAIAMLMLGTDGMGDGDKGNLLLISISFAVASWFMVAFLIGTATSEIPIPKEPRTILGSTDYDLTPVQAPTAKGSVLTLLSKIFTNQVFGHVLCRPMINKNGPDQIRDLARQAAAQNIPVISMPICRVADNVTDAMAATATDAIKKGISISYNSDEVLGVMDYHKAYRADEVTPSQMMSRVLDGMESLKYLNMFVACHRENVLEQAQASDKRWASKKPLSVFDGVPIAVKGMNQLLIEIQWNYDALPGYPFSPLPTIW